MASPTRRELAEREVPAAMPDRTRSAGIVDVASDAIISIDSRQAIVQFNRGAEAIFGWTAEEAVGQPLDILLPSRVRRAHADHVRAFGASPVAARRMGQRQTIRGVRKSGREFPAEASILKLDDGGERSYTVVLRDITDRIRQEQTQELLAEIGRILSASRDEDRSLREVAEGLTRHWADLCVIDRIGADGVIVRVASTHRRSDGVDQARRLHSVVLDRDRPHLMSRVLETGEPVLVEPVTPDHLAGIAQGEDHLALLRELRLASYMVVPLRAREELIGTILLARVGDSPPQDEGDLGLGVEIGLRVGLGVENVLLYRDAKRALEARDDVLGIVSHDLGNPLQAIFIGLESLEKARARRGDVAPEREEYYLSAIRRSAEVMERLIRDLLEIRRSEVGHLGLDPREQDLAPLIREALAVIEPLARVRSVEIDNRVTDGTLPSVCVDGDRIHQVVSNLVGNAVKHSPEGGTVRIRGAVEATEIRISVEDDGEGITPDDLERVFDRFWRGRTGRGAGIGLGLAIARGVVEAHGGTVGAESDPGRGSIFHFTLPLVPPAEATGRAFGT